MMPKEMTRRSFVKGTLLSSAGAMLAVNSERHAAAAEGSPSEPETPTGVLPMGRLGHLQVSRLILGGNLLTHFTHSRDLKYVYTLAARYNTDQKIFETLALAEAKGVNTLCIHNPEHPISLLKRYRKEMGGKIQWIICPTAPVDGDLSEYRHQIEDLVKDGCEAIYLWGVHADSLVAQDKIDQVAKAVEVAREFKVVSGVGAHDLRVIQACEQNGVNADFYIKTFHHHNYQTGPKPEQITGPYNEFPGYWCSDPTGTAEFMKTVKKPWIAFKTMAAGAIPPSSAFRYAFLHGADFILAGMFDFEIAEDAKFAAEAFERTRQRTRTWSLA